MSDSEEGITAQEVHSSPWSLRAIVEQRQRRRQCPERQSSALMRMHTDLAHWHPQRGVRVAKGGQPNWVHAAVVPQCGWYSDALLPASMSPREYQ